MYKPELSWGERVIVVCVDSYIDEVLSGRLFHSRSGGGVVFRSMSRFLTEMDHALDEISFPQPFNMVRTFGETVKKTDLARPVLQTMEGKLATFSVRVLFRQNASWQGSIRWIEGDREESFRSALELIFLMDSVLNKNIEETQVC